MYKILDDNGSVLHRSTTVQAAIQYLSNNSDIASNIEPQPTEAEYAQYDSNYIAKVAEAEGIEVPVVAQAVSSAEIFSVSESKPVSAPAEVPTAAEALKLIELKNQKKHGKLLKRLIDELIEADGNIAVAPSTPKYVLDKLTQLGYTVRPGLSGHINVSAHAVTEVSLSTQLNEVKHLIKPILKGT